MSPATCCPPRVIACANRWGSSQPVDAQKERKKEELRIMNNKQAVVFLRAVNVGGANRCQPALIAKQLSKFGVVNIGAVGTFVVRENVSESVLRAAIIQKLQFKCEI